MHYRGEQQSDIPSSGRENMQVLLIFKNLLSFFSKKKNLGNISNKLIITPQWILVSIDALSGITGAINMGRIMISFVFKNSSKINKQQKHIGFS